MSYELVPIPYDKLSETRGLWEPTVGRIAERGRCFPEQRLAEVYSGDVGLILVREVSEKEPCALIGYRILARGRDRIGKLVWLTGEGRENWLHLYPGLEQYFKERGCAGMAAFARPGWLRTLRGLGYRLVHVECEKDF